MNRNIYRLVFNTASGMLVPVAETARSRGKAASGTALVLAGLLLAGVAASVEMPVACPAGACGGTAPASVTGFVSSGSANYQVNGTQGIVSQVGDKSILNWRSFNVSPGHDVRFQQVDSLTSQNLVQGASFTSLNRIWDMNPSVIAGSISQAVGQKANIILVNTNGIAFMGGSQVNLNTFTASSLNIDNSYILGSFLTTGSAPQFEGSGGFIKVFEGARITAGRQGRVMLIAPTVVNKGTVEAPDGQVILAAGTKVYLSSASGQDGNVRGLLVEVNSPDSLNSFDADNTSVKNGALDGQEVVLKEAALDKLGNATNLGELTAPRGNVTMIGYAVNQQGIARATTSVVANGSVYLLAKDTKFKDGELLGPTDSSVDQRGGRVVLGKGSLTEVLPDVSDTTGALDGETGTGLASASQVKVLGQDVRMEGGATILAPSGEVNLIAMDDPSQLQTNNDPFTKDGIISIKEARIHIADGARISVAGLENIEVSAARNSVEVELRGDELKDSPVNRDGALRGEKAYVDISRALADANADKSTLIAKDSLESYQARTERTVAERSTAGGTVKVRSQGEAILESGAVIDLSGGSLKYTPATVKTTLLTSSGKLTDLADASAETKYDGIATRYVVDYGKWNVKETIDLGQSYRYDPGYVEGKNAGALELMGMGAVVLQADIQGRTTVGGLQRDTGTQPAGARLTVGTGSVPGDYKLNQQMEFSSTAATLPSSFGFGDVLPAGLKNTLALNPALFGKDKVANLEVFSNQAATVREALRMPQGGSVQITAKGVAVNADIEAAGGVIALNAKQGLDDTPAPLDVVVADGVTLSARGAWVNDLPSPAAGTGEVALLNGGKITLSAIGDVDLGQDTLVDVTGGGRLRADGKFTAGNGGKIGLKFEFKPDMNGVADAISEADASGVLKLGGEVRGYALGKGGVLAVSSNKIKIGGTPDSSPGTLNLDAGFFERGGFADFNLTALENLTVSDGTVIKPTVKSLELQPGYTLAPTGSKIESFTSIVKQDDRLRHAANLTLVAKQKDAGTGEILIGHGARIDADPKAKITLEALNVIDIQGSVTTPGGSITAKLNRGTSLEFDPTNTLWLGQNAVLDTSGVARTYTDSKGLVKGDVLAGGSVTLNAQTGYVVSEAGSTINVAGAAPVRLDIPNETGGLGMMVGSDAGTLSITAREGALLDGTIKAQAGSTSNRGGTFSLSLAGDPVQYYASPEFDRVVSLGQTVTPQAGGLTTGAAIPDALNGQAKISAEAMEAAGFDRITLKSRDAIRLENGLNMGANRVLPLREVQLDSPRIEMVGGDVVLKAETLRLGNYDKNHQGVSNTAVAVGGTLKAYAQLLELAGNYTLTGMARAELTGEQEIRLAGVSTEAKEPSKGALSSAADLVFHGAVVAPATYAQYTIDAAGRTVSFTRNTNSPSQPLSALGSLTVKAENIVQGGNIWAPFGQLDFQAANTLTFKDGSLTSVAAAPGSLIPFGKVVNGRSWTYQPDSTEIAQDALPEKSIRTSGADIDMQAGAQVNLAGGGDLQAYEFTVGPGGSRDILSDVGTYAILPGYASGFAPGDAQESAGFDRKVGDAVYLSGMPGLSAGTYTLLPAHYALLPGAYAVKLNNGVKDLVPGQAYSKQDGVQVVPGYVTDSRTSAPRDSRWSGFEVLSRDQVLQRSELTLTRASEFFADGRNRPQDAGLLSIATTGSVKLDAIYNLAAASGGHGAAVDISASNLVIISGNPSGIDPTATHLDVDKLSTLGAGSLLLGGTRSTSGDTTVLDIGADTVMLSNDAAHALKGGEIILAAKDTLTLKAGSVIEAQGDAVDAGLYTTTGNGVLVRAASGKASFERSGSPDGASGTLIGEVGSTIKASSSIALDATKKTDFQGTTIFADSKGNPVAGNLAMGAKRVGLGAAPASSEGLVFSQAELDGLNSLESLALTSYSTLDLYGDVSVGGVNAQSKPTLPNLILRGAGLVGINNSGKTASLRATELLIDNPANATYAAGGVLGDGTLAIQADRLVLGKGDKAIKGFSQVNVTANELIGRGTGETTIAAETNLNVARISGEQGSNQTLDASGKLNAAKITADRVLAAVSALGAKWALSGTEVLFDTQATLPSGQFKLSATTGNLEVGANAGVDVAGRTVEFFDVSRAASAGKAELISDNGDVVLQAGAVVNVSAEPGGDAGDVIIRATKGTAIVAGNTLQGSSPVDADGERGEGARFELDVNTLADFSALNTTLNQGEFDAARTLRVRMGDVSVAAADTLKAKEVRIAVDSGKLDVAGHIDASGKDAGSIGLYAKNDVTVLAGAKLDAYATGEHENGGEVEIGTVAGRLNLAAGSSIDVHAGSGGEGGEVLLRAPRTGSGAGTEVAVDGVNSDISGAKSVVVEAVKLYEGKTTLTDTGASTGTALSLATVNTDNTSFATKVGTIKSRLGKTGDASFHVRAGVEVRSTGDLTLSKDWNLGASRAGGEPGVLTLRAQGNLKLDNNLSDGFNVATPFSSSTTPATLLAGDSWSYRLIAGADASAADPLAVKPGSGDVTLKAGKLVRTGTGDIRIASGRNIILADNKSAIYTAGRIADPASGFVTPANAQFSQGGGNVSLAALGDIVGSPSAQLYSNWLFRQGKLNADGTAYTTQPAWWVRFDQFQQGIGALGGGDVIIKAGGKVENVSASAPTQARVMATDKIVATANLVRTGGGDVRVEAGSDLLGGQYYADLGDLDLKVGGNIVGQPVNTGTKTNPVYKTLYTILALGNAQARVQAQGDVNIHAVLNPHLVVQSTNNVTGAGDAKWSLFSTYGEDSGANLISLDGAVTLHNATTTLTSTVATLKESYEKDANNKTPLSLWKSNNDYKYGEILLSYLPPSLSATAFQGDVLVNGTQPIMNSSGSSNLTLLAANSVDISSKVVMSDMDPAKIPNALRPSATAVDFNPALSTTKHAVDPTHTGDTQPVRIYAVNGDVEGKSETLSLTLPKFFQVRAGRDVRDLGILAQHVNAGDISRVEAGRDVVFPINKDASDRADGSYIWVGGPGRLEVTAGRNVDLGASAGIVSRGGLDNTALPKEGVDLHVTAGVGPKGVDYVGAVDRLIASLESSGGSPDDATLWQARWLTGDDALSGSSALAAVKAVDAQTADGQRGRVREMIYSALRTTGRDSNNLDSLYAADYKRGYAALELVFPGISEKTPDGSFKNYLGEINLFASRIKSERGGNIEFMVPGGGVVVGLSNTPKGLATSYIDNGTKINEVLKTNPLGILVSEKGDVRGFARDDILVNQSRILTVGGGDILLWSSEGDIDAGKGKKTASAVPPPIVKTDKEGNTTTELQGAATGSGIGALFAGGITAGDVDLVAPKGTVNAGDAGIRAGNLNIAAQIILGADNITVSGSSSGTPVADTSAATATTSGATAAGGDQTTAALAQNLADATTKNSFRPTFITAEVVGHGE